MTNPEEINSERKIVKN